MTPEVGTLAGTPAGWLIVHVDVERYRIAPEGVKGLIFSGQSAPVTRERRAGPSPHPSGHAAVIRIREGAWIMPLASPRRFACGEAASAPLSTRGGSSDRASGWG